MMTIKRTRGTRKVPLLLRADHEDRGPYYLIDRAGYGVAWIKPAVEIRPTGEISDNPFQGNPYTRKTTWVPIFERARLAFELADFYDESLSPKDAKKIADATYKRLGNGASPGHAMRFALHLLEKREAGPVAPKAR